MTIRLSLPTVRLLGALPLLWTIASLSPGQSPILLEDVTEETGIGFEHYDGSCGRYYIVENVSAGLALFDYDRDGDVDIYLLSGAPLPGDDTDVRPGNALYRNEGGWRFTDVTAQAGVGDTGYGLGVASGDYDNDGHLDLYLNNCGPNVLYHNNGDGTFSNVTARAGVANGNKVGAGTAFLDIDGDGDLDLYVGNYVLLDFEEHELIRSHGQPWYPGPWIYEPEPDTLYRNNGNGTFADVSIESGIGAHAGTSMGMVCADYDRDRDTDVFVCNDVKSNFLFENDGQGNFQEVGLFAGVAYNLDGRPNGNMGVDCGDYDNDGLLDFLTTDFQNESAVLYQNLGDGFLEDVTLKSGAGNGTLPHVTWGVGLVDFNNDGHRDAFMACGHLQDKVELVDQSMSYHARNVLLANLGNGRFVNVSDESGNGLDVRLSSRGAGFDDLDEDGDIDVVVLNSRREPTILRNDSPNQGRWLQVRLRGTTDNRDGVGTQVTVTAGSLVQTAEVHGGRGYQSHYGICLHFGLGSHEEIDKIEVRWLGGQTDVALNVAANQLVTIAQGQGLLQE